MSRLRSIQIRNVPDDLHRRLKILAAIENMSLSNYVLRAITALAAGPRDQELASRYTISPLRLARNAADLVREHARRR